MTWGQVMVGRVLRVVGGALLGQLLCTVAGKLVAGVRTRPVVDRKRAALLEAEEHLTRALGLLDEHRLWALDSCYRDLGEIEDRVSDARAHLARYIARGLSPSLLCLRRRDRRIVRSGFVRGFLHVSSRSCPSPRFA